MAGGSPWRSIAVALTASTAGYTAGMGKASAVTKSFEKDAKAAGVAAEAGAVKAESKWAGMASRSAAIGSKWTKNVTAPVAAFAVVAIASAESYNKATRIIEQRTGATGSKLKGLTSDFHAVAETTGADLSHVAEVMSRLNIGFGLTGKPLQDLTRQFLTLERIAGDGAPTIDQVTKAMNAWRISSGNVAGELDHVYKATEKTGVPVSELLDNLAKFAPQLRGMGLSIDESLALIGVLGKNGAATAKIFMGLNQFIAKNGSDSGKLFRSTISQAEKLYKQGGASIRQADDLLTETFGKRAGPALARFVRDGKLNFKSLAQTIADSDGEIGKIGAATVPLSVRFNQLKNQAILALAPIGNQIVPALISSLGHLLPLISDIAGGFGHLPSAMRTGLVSVGLVAAAVGPAIKAALFLGSGIGKVASTIKLLGYESIAFVQATIAELGGLGAALGLVVLPLAVGGALYYKIHQNSVRAKQDAKDVATGIRSVVDEIKRTGESVDTAFIGTSLAKFQSDTRTKLDFTKVSLRDLSAGLKLSGKDWDKWRTKTAIALHGPADSSGLRRNVVPAMHLLDQLRLQYQGAEKDGSKFVRQQLQVAEIVGRTGTSVKRARTEVQLINDALKDDAYAKAFTKAGFSIGTFTAQAHRLGTTLEDALTIDPKKFKKDLDALDKYLSPIQAKWAGFTDVTTLTDNPVDPKAVKTAVQAVTDAKASLTKAVAGDKSAAGYADDVKSAARAVADAQQSLKDLKATDSPLNADKVKQFYKDRQFEAGEFVNNIKKAYAAGYDPGVISKVITAGPEAGGALLKTLVADTSASFVQIVNDGQAALNQISMMATDQARLNYIATQAQGARGVALVQELQTAMAVSQATTAGSVKKTAEDIANETGIPLAKVKQAIKDYQLQAEVKPSVDMNTDPGMIKLRQLDQTLTYLDRPHPGGAVDVDTSAAQKKLDDLNAQLEQIGGRSGFDASNILRMYANATDPAAKAAYEGIYKALTQAPGRAAGGPVRRGQPYIVGEHRPELFVPNSNGHIVPKVPSLWGQDNRMRIPANNRMDRVGRGAGGSSPMTFAPVLNVSVAANGDQTIVDLVHRELIPAIDAQMGGLVATFKRHEARHP